jgi:hypothetical protein
MSNAITKLSDEDDDTHVWGANGDVQISSDDLAKFFEGVDGDHALIVKGNLLVDGHLSIQDWQQFKIDGDVRCTSFCIGEGLLECEDLHAAQWFEFSCDETIAMENLDISGIKAEVGVCPYIDSAELAGDVEFRFECNDVDDEQKTFQKILEQNFDSLVQALEGGATIDDEWVKANKVE